MILLGEQLDLMAQQKLHDMQQSHKRKVLEFLRLKPEAFHLRGVDYFNVLRPKTRQPVPMGDLNSVQLREVLPYCLRHSTPIILETLDARAQIEDINFVNSQYRLIARK